MMVENSHLYNFLSNYFSKEWEYALPEVMYSEPVADEIPGVMRNAGSVDNNPIGEMDLMLYSDDTVGYIELKNSGKKGRAGNQLTRAQEYWHNRGFDFAGGYTNGKEVLPWNGSGFEENAVRFEDFTEDSQSISSKSVKDRLEKHKYSDKPPEHINIAEDWTHFYQDIIFGHPIENDEMPSGIAIGENGNQIGHMDQAFFDKDNRKIVHLEFSEDMDVAEEKLLEAKNFWETENWDHTGIYCQNGLQMEIL